MKEPYLEVTFRHGRPIAAYYYLPRGADQRSARSRRVEPGLVIDFAADGQAIGIEITTPTIGIGAGPGCAGQVLVLYDMLDIYPGKMPRFVRNFMKGSDSIESAVAAYVRAVKDGSFPTDAHAY